MDNRDYRYHVRSIIDRFAIKRGGLEWLVRQRANPTDQAIIIFKTTSVRQPQRCKTGQWLNAQITWMAKTIKLRLYYLLLQQVEHRALLLNYYFFMAAGGVVGSDPSVIDLIWCPRCYLEEEKKINLLHSQLDRIDRKSPCSDFMNSVDEHLKIPYRIHPWSLDVAIGCSCYLTINICFKLSHSSYIQSLLRTGT